jgi:hypothetical protein
MLVTRSEGLITSRKICTVVKPVTLSSLINILRSGWDGILLLAAIIGHHQIQWLGFADSCYLFVAVSFRLLNYSITLKNAFHFENYFRGAGATVSFNIIMSL